MLYSLVETRQAACFSSDSYTEGGDVRFRIRASTMNVDSSTIYLRYNFEEIHVSAAKSLNRSNFRHVRIQISFIFQNHPYSSSTMEKKGGKTAHIIHVFKKRILREIYYLIMEQKLHIENATPLKSANK